MYILHIKPHSWIQSRAFGTNSTLGGPERDSWIQRNLPGWQWFCNADRDDLVSCAGVCFLCKMGNFIMEVTEKLSVVPQRTPDSLSGGKVAKKTGQKRKDRFCS